MTKKNRVKKENVKLDSIQSFLNDRIRAERGRVIAEVIRKSIEQVTVFAKKAARFVKDTGKTKRGRIVWLGAVATTSCLVTILVFSQLYRVELIIRSLIYKDSTAQLKLSLLNNPEIELDPVSVLHFIEKKEPDVVFVDLRSDSEYRASHIRGAISTPLYADFRSVYQTQIDIHRWFAQVEGKTQKNRFVIVYGYWENSSINNKIGELLRSKGNKYKLLSVGFNTFKNNYHIWMPGGDMNDPVVGKYLEGKYVEKSLLPQDGVPPLPVAPQSMP